MELRAVHPRAVTYLRNECVQVNSKLIFCRTKKGPKEKCALILSLSFIWQDTGRSSTTVLTSA